MKTPQLKNSSSKRGLSRLWLGVAALIGAAGAYLADPERGGARREAAVRQVSGAAKSVTQRGGRWRDAVGARLSRPAAEDKLPEQVSVPTDPGPAPVKPPSTSVPEVTEASAKTKKTDA